ncbi:hypothetical protein CCYA_CCYA10G2819 [Cyanidiococcus yangmingshanensis]|nr:hypothetical protein CCYA_CCYA10G2819 [Cyanidiococcus yangmingshanensis]
MMAQALSELRCALRFWRRSWTHKEAEERGRFYRGVLGRDVLPGGITSKRSFSEDPVKKTTRTREENGTDRRIVPKTFRGEPGTMAKATRRAIYQRTVFARFLNSHSKDALNANTNNQNDQTKIGEPESPVAIVLLSGGLDSATTLAFARSQGYACRALSFEYGQRHRCELEAARRIALAQQVLAHHWIRLDFGCIGGSALTNTEILVPKAPQLDMVWKTNPESIPVTYVPARNTIFLAYALALAEVHRSYDIFIGANAVDYSGYPDCRPQYFQAFEHVAELGTRAGVEKNTDRRFRIHAPLLQMPKTEIIREGLRLGVDYSMTHSCYDPLDEAGTPCRRCDACRIRHTAFRQLGIEDPQLACLSTNPTMRPCTASSE